MKIAIAQMRLSEDMAANLNKTLEKIEAAAAQGADLILFPEIQLSPFFPKHPGQDASRYRMTMDSPQLRAVQDACAAHRIFASPNFYMTLNGGHYDTSFLIDDTGAILGTQKMVHIAQAPQFYEQDYYAPSDEGFRVFDTAFGKIGIVVCFDRHYPESFRTLALMGADLILIPTANTKAEPSELFEWEVRVQAFQNSVVAAMCNRVGQEGEMVFSGESIICDANGTCIVKADDTAQLLYADIDLAQSAEIRRRRPYTQLRRKEWYL